MLSPPLRRIRWLPAPCSGRARARPRPGTTRKDVARKLCGAARVVPGGRRGRRDDSDAGRGYDGRRGWINATAVAPASPPARPCRTLVQRIESLLTEAGCPKINLQIRGKPAGRRVLSPHRLRPRRSDLLGKRPASPMRRPPDDALARHCRQSWNDDRGFGFIEADQGGQEVFVHIKAARSRGATAARSREFRSKSN